MEGVCIVQDFKQEHKNGWRYIVWVGGCDNYYKNFMIAQMDFYKWVLKDYDDVFLTEIKKDGTEEVLRNSEEHNFKERKNNG